MKWLGAAIVALAVLASACAPASPDLVVSDCSVLDVRTGEVRAHQRVEIRDGRIAAIRDESDATPRGSRVVAARGRLLVPGFIDAHGHTEFVLGDSITPSGSFLTHLSMEADSIAAYRSRFAAAYLPFGVTAVRDLGSSESDIAMLLAWMEPSFEAPDFFPVGGALVSEEPGRTPAPTHTVVRDSADAVRHVDGLHAQGIRHLKLYWRLREPEFRAALAEATALGMNVTGHIDYQVIPFATTLDLGLRSFEHAYTVGVGAMTHDEYVAGWAAARRLLEGNEDGLFYVGIMEMFNRLGPDHPAMNALIDRLAATHSTVVPTLHIFAQRFGLTWFTTPSVGAFDHTEYLSGAQRERAIAGYRILAGYVRRMHEKGIQLATGSDWKDPGKAILSEMLLLHDLGIPMKEVFRIASLEGAEALGVADRMGTLEVGKQADLVLLDARVLEEPAALLAEKVVIMRGRVVGPWTSRPPSAATPSR